MTEFNPLNDQNGPPDDVATLYSWANLHGAKYRDFSASRAQTRETARLRVEQALQETQHSQAEAEAAQAADAQRAAEEAHAQEQAARQAEWEAQHAAEQAKLELAAEEAARQAEWKAQEAAHQAAEMAARRAAQVAAEHTARMEAEQAAQRAAEEAANQATRQNAKIVAQRARRKASERAAAPQIAEQNTWQQPQTDRFSAPPASGPMAPHDPPPQVFEHSPYSRPQTFAPGPDPRAGQPQYGSSSQQRARQDAPAPRNPWALPEMPEHSAKPAWTSGNYGTPDTFVPQPPFPPASADLLPGSHDRLNSRWFALRGVFNPNVAPPEAVPAAVVSRAPSLAVFSLAGGVGKTSLVATLGRALSSRGERVLLVDTAAFGLLPFFFGAADQRPGQLRTFSPPGGSSDAPIQMVAIDPDEPGVEPAGPEYLAAEISKFARAAGRVIVDLATASGATTRRIMRMAPTVLVPVVPDMNSVVSVSSIEAFFEHNSNPAGISPMPFYVLNQFDSTLPLHLDVREVLSQQLGERLLPFALRRTPAMSEALAEGMTVMDYAPNSPLAEDFATLAGWVKSLSAPASTSYRGVRWSER